MQRPTIGSKDDIVGIVKVIAERVEALVQRTIGRQLPITYLTIFSHHPHEFERFLEWASELGSKTDANNGFRFMLNEPVQTVGGPVASIRIRRPDPYRSQIGCADVEVKDYANFKATELSKYPDNLRLIERGEYEMIEFFDFDSNDVLAYVLAS